MFDPEFYPTPKEVVMKMIEPYIAKIDVSGWLSPQAYYRSGLAGKTILEPSAGSGNILDVISDLELRDVEMYACERDPMLVETLKGKNYAVISNDFLQYDGDMYFDLIIMNPPFSNGDKHLLHAWNILHSGDIVCLLNEETVKNPYTSTRKLLCNLIEEHGSVEYLGNCFTDAERKTDVNVAMVRLHKEAKENMFDFNFEKVADKREFEFDDSTFSNTVATSDLIGNMMVQFEKLKDAYVKYLSVMEELEFYSNHITTDYLRIREVVKTADEQTGKRRKYNRFVKTVRKNMWSKVINQADFKKYMTSEVLQNFDKFIADQGNMEFNKANVFNLIEFLFNNRITILENAVVGVFEQFTKYHKENRVHVEGWKSNDKYKVSRKVVLPDYVRYGEYMSAHDLKKYGDKFGIAYSKTSAYRDIDTVMCYLTGKDVNKCYTIERALEDKFNELGKVYSGTFDNTAESDFFEIKFFKKGTVHLYFKNEKLWDEFNMRACIGKKWLPEYEEKEYRKKKAAENQQAYEQPKKETLALEMPEDIFELFV
ncbi:class I SAM-dependent methyltransferase [Mongoliitalea daihaiensis]|uniref:class I SAM-dependent methyltransferase n=1 Tax=Mongoliitalea daihaiensis TaxID=2782006 RepID=UPI001F1B80AA|nr:DUF4942 domain-containing protein [Mongoliitalea daihaiensis]UJP63969.1 DUF4942 domain-containing protein [Mongoliitalea daihaiensis]